MSTEFLHLFLLFWVWGYFLAAISQVQVHDWDGASKDDLIGECTFTMREVLAMIANPSLDTLNLHAATGRGTKHSPAVI